MREEDYMKNIETTAFAAIGIDILVGIVSVILIWRKTNLQAIYMNSKDKYGPWSLFGRCSVGPVRCFTGFGKVRFIVATMIIGFGMPLLDTISGYFKIFVRQTV